MKTADSRNRLAEIDDAGRKLPGYRWGVETRENVLLSLRD